MPDAFTYYLHFLKTKKAKKKQPRFTNLAAFFFSFFFVTANINHIAQCGTHVIISTAAISGLQAGMQLRLISVDGRIITTKITTNNTENINVQRLATGIYMVQAVKDGALMNTMKFSKK